MREPISVDPDVYDAASKVFGADIHSRLSGACTGLQSRLSGTGGMAGTDPAGARWASSYDDTARTVHSLMGDLAAASTVLAAMLQQTGFNHGMADSASDPGHSVPTPPDGATYKPGPENLPDLPSARGSSSGPPALWWLVEHTVGYVWPDGDPGKLRAAASAWSAAADSLDGATAFIPEALSAIASQQSPEVDDAFTVCSAMGSHISDVSSACRALSSACSGFASEVDKAHHDIESQLTSLAEWTAGIEAGGFLLGLVTAGGADVAAQGAEASRVATVAARIGKIIQTLVDLAGTVARGIDEILGNVAEVAGRLKVILGARLSKVVTALAARLPGSAEDAADDALQRIEAWDKSDAKKVQDIVSPGGEPVGDPGSPGVQVLDSQQELDQIWDQVKTELGREPDKVINTPKGSIYQYDLGDGDIVQYRTFSRSGGDTIDLNIDGEPTEKIHVKQ